MVLLLKQQTKVINLCQSQITVSNPGTDQTESGVTAGHQIFLWNNIKVSSPQMYNVIILLHEHTLFCSICFTVPPVGQVCCFSPGWTCSWRVRWARVLLVHRCSDQQGADASAWPRSNWSAWSIDHPSSSSSSSPGRTRCPETQTSVRPPPFVSA